MNIIREVNRPGAVALLSMIFGACVLFSGCEKAPDDTKDPGKKVGAETSAKATADETSAALLEQIEKSEDMLTWYNLRSEYQKGETRDKNLDAAFAEKESDLRKENPAKPINNSLEIVDFSWKIYPGQEVKEGENLYFEAKWLFYKKTEIEFEPDQKILFILRGIPSEKDLNFERELSRKRKYVELVYKLTPSIDMWEKGEYFLLTKKTYERMPNYPYTIHTFFRGKKGKDSASGFSGDYGKRVNLGWYADLGE